MNNSVIIGYGYWGKILKSKLNNLNIETEIINKSKYKEFLNKTNEYKLIIVSTKEKNHIKIINDILSNLCLKDSLIFCEKPFSKNVNSYNLLNKNNIYISDVFLYNNKYLKIKSFCNNKKIKTINIETSNNSVSQKDSILYDLLYHDIYIIMDLKNYFSISNIYIHYHDENELKLQFKINNSNIYLYYSRKKEKKHKNINILIKNKTYNYNLNYDRNDKDAIENMFSSLLKKNYNIEYNNLLSKSCIININKIKEKIKEMNI